MNSYLLIILISFCITSISFLVEYIYPFIHSKERDYISNFMYRFLHFLIFFYLPTFLLFFTYNSIDAYIYLGLVLLMFSTWYIFECCILTYYELRTYNIDHNIYDTTFHPTMKSIFREYSDILMNIFGVLITLNVGYIIYNNKQIPLVVKILYSLLYIFFFGDSILKSRAGKKQYYPKSPDCLFIKYIHKESTD